MTTNVSVCVGGGKDVAVDMGKEALSAGPPIKVHVMDKTVTETPWRPSHMYLWSARGEYGGDDPDIPRRASPVPVGKRYDPPLLGMPRCTGFACKNHDVAGIGM